MKPTNLCIVSELYYVLYAVVLVSGIQNDNAKYLDTTYVNNINNVNNPESNFENNFPKVEDGEETETLPQFSFKNIYVRVINSEEELTDFLRNGTLQTVIFLPLDSRSLERYSLESNFKEFLHNYDIAASYLLRYQVHLGLVNCSSNLSSGYCTSDKAGNFAYGFQNEQEKIGFPIETLFSVDSIIASTLHLSLLHTVPIIQSLSERKELEDRCRGKCDVILSLHKSLGTKEHRLFLEISEAFKTKFLFGLTTYSAAVHGLPISPILEDITEVDPVIFVLHCSNSNTEILSKNFKLASKTVEELGNTDEAKSVLDPCTVVSHYHGIFRLPDFTDFLESFQRPLWNNIGPDSDLSDTLLSDSGIPKVVFIYDSGSEKRVLDSVQTIAKLLLGSVSIFTIHRKQLTKEIEKQLRITSREIRTPAVVFFSKEQVGETSILNDYDDALNWIYDELASVRHNRYDKEARKQHENHPIHPFFELEELQQDDEVVSAMVEEDMFTMVAPLAGKEDVEKVFQSAQKSVTAIVFYVSWDPVSNLVLQHLQATAKAMNELGRTATTRRLNCFDFPEVCDSFEVFAFPVMKIWSADDQEMTYEGPVDANFMLMTFLLLECEGQPLQMNATEHLDLSLRQIGRNISCLAVNKVSSFTVGIFPTETAASVYREVSKKLYGYKLTGILIDEGAVAKKCLNSSGCVVIMKTEDSFQPEVVINEYLSNAKVLHKLIEHSTENVFGNLSPDNNAVMNLEQDCKSGDIPSKNILVILILHCTGLNGQHCTSDVDSTPSESEYYGVCENGIRKKAKQTFQGGEICDLSQSPSQHSSNKVFSGKHFSVSADKEYFSIIGHIAAQFSTPGLVFAYIRSTDHLAFELIETYRLRGNNSHLMAVNKGKGNVYVFNRPSSHIGESIEQWVTSVTEETVEPSLMLPSEDWSPELEGFDYLSYMDDDLQREAEEQLAFDMEIDAGSYSTEGSRPSGRKRN